MKKRLVIIGGVAGGANVAARARRLNEEVEILLLERGPHISFANCGLPYYVGGEIESEADLLLHTPESLGTRFNLEVRVFSEVRSINRSKRTVTIHDLSKNLTYDEHYDDLVLATGAAPVKPKLPGINLPSLHTVRNVPDVIRLKEKITQQKSTHAVVVGGGFIGLEMAEQLSRLGLQVTIVEGNSQVMMPIDAEMAELIHRELSANSIQLVLNDPVSSFEQSGEYTVVRTKSGKEMRTSVVILAIGVKPETDLAREAGLDLGPTGGIRVSEKLQTSDPNIWAVGDCIEVKDLITGKFRIIPLAGPANRQGRLVAENIINNCGKKYSGTLGTSVLRVFSLTIAAAGANERMLSTEGIPYKCMYLHPNSHAGYYPGASPIAIKALFSPTTKKLLGVQAIGKEGVEKRVDVLATAIKGGLTIEDIADLELCYAPPFGSAKDPVNLLGMMGQNIIDGLVDNIPWNEFKNSIDSYTLLDVRGAAEVTQGSIPRALHIPLPELRTRLNEIPREKPIVVYCQSGQRSYYACRILMQNGFSCRNLSGAFKTYSTMTRPLDRS